jgi:hypothetical protein
MQFLRTLKMTNLLFLSVSFLRKIFVVVLVPARSRLVVHDVHYYLFCSASFKVVACVIMFLKRIISAIIFLLSLVRPAWSSSSSSCGPTKVFLLDGQSNMVGMASIEHLRVLLNNTKTHDEYAHLWNETTQDFVEREDVYAKFDYHVGKLTVGFGAKGGTHFGTELEFGWYVSS